MKDKLKTKLWQRIWANRVRWLCLLGGIGALVGAWFLGQLWAVDRSNLFLTVVVICLFAGGPVLLYRGWKISRTSETVIVGKGKMQGPANSLNIYIAKDEDTGRMIPKKIAFELKKNLTGQPWQCLNDGCWYYLNFFDLTKKALVPFNLPDSQYFDPREFANVITMPAHKKLFELRQTLFQKVAPWIMLVGFVAAGFFLLVTGGQ